MIVQGIFGIAQIYNITCHNQNYLGVLFMAVLSVRLLTPLQKDRFSYVLANNIGSALLWF